MSKQLYLKAIEVYGIEHQMDKTSEELAELIQAINKFKYNQPMHLANIVQELGDVENMIEQLKLIICELSSVDMITLSKEIKNVRQFKNDRLTKRIYELSKN